MIYSFDNYSLDTDRQELRCGSHLVPVEPQVLDLLQFLIRNRDRVVSKDDLITHVWNGRIVSDSTLTSRIAAARLAIPWIEQFVPYTSGPMAHFLEGIRKAGLAN